MRILLRILLFPVVLVLTVLVAFCRFFCLFSGMILSLYISNVFSSSRIFIFRMLYQPVQRGQLQLWHRERRKDRTLRGGEEPLLVFFQQRQRPEGCHHRVRQRFESSLRNDHRCLQFPRETVYGHLQTEWEEETSLAGG